MSIEQENARDSLAIAYREMCGDFPADGQMTTAQLGAALVSGWAATKRDLAEARARASQSHQKNQDLTKELRDMSLENGQLRRASRILTTENENLSEGYKEAKAQLEALACWMPPSPPL